MNKLLPSAIMASCLGLIPISYLGLIPTTHAASPTPATSALASEEHQYHCEYERQELRPKAIARTLGLSKDQRTALKEIHADTRLRTRKDEGALPARLAVLGLDPADPDYAHQAEQIADAKADNARRMFLLRAERQKRTFELLTEKQQRQWRSMMQKRIEHAEHCNGIK